MNRQFLIAGLGGVAATGISVVAFQTLGQAQTSKAPQVINLTQVACQFVETEAKNHAYKTKKADDCRTINVSTLGQRKAAFKGLKLKPGEYIFRVSNKNVPYELGFYLRGEGVKGALLPKVSGGGLTQGKTLDYRVSLKAGQYVFSCPLNPTPDYPLVVQ